MRCRGWTVCDERYGEPPQQQRPSPSGWLPYAPAADVCQAWGGTDAAQVRSNGTVLPTRTSTVITVWCCAVGLNVWLRSNTWPRARCRIEPESGLPKATERRSRASFQAPQLLAEVRQQEREACEAVAAVHLALGLLPPPERRHSTASSTGSMPPLPAVNASDLAGAVQQLIVAFKVSLLLIEQDCMIHVQGIKDVLF